MNIKNGVKNVLSIRDFTREMVLLQSRQVSYELIPNTNESQTEENKQLTVWLW